jgi:hypothetical protein
MFQPLFIWIACLVQTDQFLMYLNYKLDLTLLGFGLRVDEENVREQIEVCHL